MTESGEIVETNVRAPHYFIATARWNCRQCAERTPVHALVLPEEHEIRIDDDWEVPGLPARMFYVDYMSTPAQRCVYRIVPRYWLDRDDAIGSSYYMNHCEHCGAKQTDRDLHEEYPGAFCSVREEPADGARLAAVHEPLAAHAAGFAIDLRADVG